MPWEDRTEDFKFEISDQVKDCQQNGWQPWVCLFVCLLACLFVAVVVGCEEHREPLDTLIFLDADTGV